MIRLVTILFMLGLLQPALSQENAAAQPEQAELTQLREWIEKLGHDDFQTRELAQEQVIELGHANPKPIIALLLHVYRVSPDPEVRQRLRGSLQILVTRHLYEPEEGYMGVIVRPVNRPVRIENAIYWPLKLRLVLQDSTAKLGELQVGDRIVGVDNVTFGRAYSPGDLAHYVRVRKPGNTVTLHVIQEEGIVQRVVTLGIAPDTPNEVEQEAHRQAFFQDWLRSQLHRAR